MPKFRAGGEDEFPDRIPAQADTYRVKIDDYQMAKTTPGKYEKGGRDQIRFLLELLHIEGDEEAELLDTKDQPIDENFRVMFFFDPERMGLKPRVARSRAFLAAALGVPVEQPVEYEDYEDLAEDLVGRELIVDLTVNGQYNNVDGCKPVRKRVRKRAEKGDLTEVAAKVFTEEPEAVQAPAEEEEDY